MHYKRSEAKAWAREKLVGQWTTMITPFTSEDELDEKGLAANVEHVLKLVMESCDTVTVLDHGEKIAEGPPAEVKDNHRVIEAYLGKEMDDAEVRAFLKAS